MTIWATDADVVHVVASSELDQYTTLCSLVLTSPPMTEELPETPVCELCASIQLLLRDHQERPLPE